jgi:Cys-tRNA(Pro)/Cys-tRNA(Cys) deacylase
MKKTNAMRFLETNHVAYEVYTYEVLDGKIDGVSVAQKIGKPVENVYKTLVTIGNSGELAVFIIPVAYELDLKKAAVAAYEKSIQMLPVKDITKHTGYIRGGCSPFAMKKAYPTFVCEEAMLLDSMIVSAGQIGLQVEIHPDELIRVIQATYCDLELK